MPPRITLLIAHPGELLRTGLRAMVDGGRVSVVGEAADAKTALALAKKLGPGVMLVDVGIAVSPGSDCFELVHTIRQASPATQIIVFASIENPTYVARAIAAGAADFLGEGVTGKQLLTAVENAAAGKAPAGSGPFASVVARLTAVEPVNWPATQPGKSSVKRPLTPRELQVLRHIGYGLSNEEIARSLGIGIETVKEHVQHLLRKLDVPDRTAAAVMAVRAGLV